MSVEWAGFVISCVAIGISLAAAWYARAQARETKRANDNTDLLRLTHDVRLELERPSSGGLAATLRSVHPVTLKHLTVRVLPEAKHPATCLGFLTGSSGGEVSPAWDVGELRTGEAVQAQMADLRDGDCPNAHALICCTIGKQEHSWVRPLAVPQESTIF